MVGRAAGTKAAGQNRSTAVMQRRVEAQDALDDYPTAPWAARALADHVLRRICGPLNRMVAWEPTVNRGHLARGLRDRFGVVHCSDIHDYGAEAVMDGIRPGVDFLLTGSDAEVGEVDWIITNPPFRLGAEFVLRALSLKPRHGVAMFLRSAFAEGEDRFHRLFHPHPCRAEAQFAERVVLHRGVLRRAGSKYLDPDTGVEKTAGTATAYPWFVWTTEHPSIEERMRIPPCRHRLEIEGDYPILPHAMQPGIDREATL